MNGLSPHAIRVIYWVITGLFCALLLLSSTGGFLQPPEAKEMMAQLGYPMHLLLILSIGKVLAVIALVQQRWHTIKEWAYAGLTYDFICAAVAWAAIGNWGNAYSLAVPMGLLVLHYGLWKLRLRPEVVR